MRKSDFSRLSPRAPSRAESSDTAIRIGSADVKSSDVSEVDLCQSVLICDARVFVCLCVCARSQMYNFMRVSARALFWMKYLYTSIFLSWFWCMCLLYFRKALPCGWLLIRRQMRITNMSRIASRYPSPYSKRKGAPCRRQSQAYASSGGSSSGSSENHQGRNRIKRRDSKNTKRFTGKSR